MDPRQQQRTGPSVPPRDNASVVPRDRQAAAQVVRSQLDRIYDQKNGVTTPTTAAPTPHGVSPYERTHSQPHMSQEDQWKKYHTAWQTYYQKYYERYYISEVQKATRQSKDKKPQQNAAAATTAKQPTASTPQNVITQDQALNDLRQNILTTAQKSAKKVRKSRHFIPIAAAVVVLLVFASLQYNQLVIANVKAYISPGAIEPQSIIVDPSVDIPVGPESKMIIPKINVDAPIVMNVGPTEKEQLAAMADGIAHVRYPGASAVPGQVGNTVFSAHSSSDWLDSGKYKFIFVQLERLAEGDVIYINYKSQRYTYKVSKRVVVMPNEVGALRYTGKKPVITLITCVPLGTADKRLLVTAEQISPDPNKAKKAPKQQQQQQRPNNDSSMAGTSPTFLERLFGAQ